MTFRISRRSNPARSLLILAAGLGLSASCAAQPTPPATPPTPPPDSTPASPDKAPAAATPEADEAARLAGAVAAFDHAIPGTLEVKRAPTGHMLVKPTVNGVAGGWWIFDTGAGVGVISTAHTDEFHLRADGSITGTGVGGSGDKALFRADTLALGPLTIRNEPLMQADLSFLKKYLGEEIVGVVGYGVLSVSVVELDNATPRIVLHDPATYTANPGPWSELTIMHRLPTVHATFEGREGVFRLDTGANGYVTFHQPAVEKWKLLEGRELQGPVSDAKLGGVGGFVAAKRGTLATFVLGGVKSEHVRAEFATEAKGVFGDGNIDGNIGADLLKPFTLVLDYTKGRIAFVPRPASGVPDGSPRE